MKFTRILVPGYVYCDRVFNNSKEVFAIVVKYQDGEISFHGYSGLVPEEEGYHNEYKSVADIKNKVLFKQNWGWNKEKFMRVVKCWEEAEENGFLDYEDIEFLYELKDHPKVNGYDVNRKYEFLI